jgi:hypothetical protein
MYCAVNENIFILTLKFSVLKLHIIFNFFVCKKVSTAEQLNIFDTVMIVDAAVMIVSNVTN